MSGVATGWGITVAVRTPTLPALSRAAPACFAAATGAITPGTAALPIATPPDPTAPSTASGSAWWSSLSSSGLERNEPAVKAARGTSATYKAGETNNDIGYAGQIFRKIRAVFSADE